MACNIQLDQDNTVIRVEAENGNESILFSAINNNALISQEQALEAYKNIYAPKFNSGDTHPIKTDENGEPILYYRSAQGNTYNNYKEALDDSQTGDIQGIVITSDNISYNPESYADVVVEGNNIRVNSENAFQELFRINANSNPETTVGFTNQQIRLGQISDLKKDGKVQGAGIGALSLVNSEAAKQAAQNQFGKETVIRYEDGTLELNVTPNEIIRYEGGEISKTQFLRDLKEGKQPQLEKRMGRAAVMGHAFDLYREKNNLFKDGKPATQPLLEYSEVNLQNSLKSFLSKLGVNVTSIEDYVERYTDKNGVEPTAEALADIANKVIAYSGGQISTSDLTEETAHFAIEAYQDQETLDRMLENVHLSNEWKQDSERYLQVYGKKYQGEQLDNIVRREILGKILSRKLQENFVETQNTPVEAGFTNLLRQLWQSVIGRIRSLITPSIQTELEGFTNTIANNILNNEFEDVFSESSLSKSDFILYSLNDKRVSTRLQKYYNTLQKINGQLKKSRTGNIDSGLNSAKALLDNTEELNNAEQWLVIQQLNSSLARPLDRVVRVVDAALINFQNGDPNQNKLYLDGETITAINSLSEVREALQEVISVVENNVLKEIDEIDKNATLRDLKTKFEQINKLDRDKNLLNVEGVDNVVDKITASLGLPENYREGIKNKVGQVTKDITTLGRWFGQPQYANNDYLNILSKLFANNNTKATQDTQSDIQPLRNYIADNGYTLSKFRELVETDEKGNPTGRLISEIKIGDFYQDLENEKVRLIKEAIPDISEREKPADILKRVENIPALQRQAYEDNLKEWINANIERQFEDSYYEKRESDTSFMSVDTKDLLKSFSSRRANILRKYAKGAVISEVDRLEIEAIARDRKLAKSTTTDDGSLKEGVDKRISEDLIRADTEFAEKNKDKVYTLRKEFVEALTDLEIGGEKANQNSLKFIEANGGIRFSRAFYEALGNRADDADKKRTPKVVSRLRDTLDELDEEDAEQVEAIADNLEELLSTRSDILRKYQKTGNPSEVDTQVMPEIAKEKIKELDSNIQKAFREANAKLRRNGVTEVESPLVATENTVNQSYFEDLKNAGVKESQIGTFAELEFLYNNVPTDDQVEVSKFGKKIEDLQSGVSDNIEPKYRRFFSNKFGISLELSDDVFTDEVLNYLNLPQYRNTLLSVEFARTKLYSYYKRFAPQGYSELLKALQEGKINPSRLLTDREALIEEFPAAEYVEITPNYTWNENTTENERNPNFNPNWEGGIYQPKISRYRNQEYYNKFNFDANGNATTNTEDFQMLQLFHQANRKAAENYQITTDIYKLPQFSKGTTQKVLDAFRVGIGETVKRSFQDTFLNRIDEMDYGQVDNESHNTIPVMGVYDLEERTDVSLDLALTFAMLLKQSNLNKYRRSSVSSVMAIRQQIAEQKFTNGKTGDNSNAVQMADNFVQANIYGVKQSRKLEVNIGGYKVDLSKLALVLHRGLQGAALKFSPVIALTNYTTGYLQLNVTESIIGQFVNRNSNMFATKEFNLNQLPTLLSETGKINKTSKVYKLLESSGAIDFDNALENSNLGRVGVAFTNMGWSGFLLGDISLKSKVFIATFDDLRVVDGVGFMTYNQYKQRPENNGLNKNEITSKWDTLREDSLWNALENNEGETLKVKQSVIDKFGQEKVNEVLTNALQRSAQIAAQIDGQMTETERIAASRDPLLRFTTSMRGYLFSALNSRLQMAKYNLLTGQEVEGSYITSGRYINNIVRKMIDERGIRNLMSAVKHEWNVLDDAGKSNMQRTLADFALFLALLGISALAMASSDDDDSYLYTFASYILLRTTSETGSLSVGMTGNVLDVVEKPLLVSSFLRSIYDGGFFDKIKSGSSKYQGLPKLFALGIKNSPLKQIYDLEDVDALKKTRDTYRQLNQGLYFLSSDKETEEFLNYFNPEFAE